MCADKANVSSERCKYEGVTFLGGFAALEQFSNSLSLKVQHPAIPSVLISYRAQEALCNHAARALAKHLQPSQHYLWSVNHDHVRKESRNDTSPYFITENLRGITKERASATTKLSATRSPTIYMFFKNNLKNWREKNLLRAAVKSDTTVESGSVMIAGRLFWKSTTRYLPSSQLFPDTYDHPVLKTAY